MRKFQDEKEELHMINIDQVQELLLVKVLKKNRTVNLGTLVT